MLHQVIDHGSESNLDDVAAQPPHDGFIGAARVQNRTNQIAKTLGGENVRQLRDKSKDILGAIQGFAEHRGVDLAFAIGQWVRGDTVQIERLDRIQRLRHYSCAYASGNNSRSTSSHSTCPRVR